MPIDTSIGDFCRKYSISLTELATKFGVSESQLYHISKGRRQMRPLYTYALKALAAEVCREKMPSFRAPVREPPQNRDRVRCPKCHNMMYRLKPTKDPNSGTRLWRMFCTGRRANPHRRIFMCVDDFGIEQTAPSKVRRRRRAPFEEKEGLTKCELCGQPLQWQELLASRWGYKTLYCYRCTNFPGHCALAGRRVYRDANGKIVKRDPNWRLKQRAARWSDVCPICNSPLWKAGTHEGGRLIEVHCKNAIQEKTTHIRDGIRYPIVFYFRRGRTVFYVFGTKRRRDGRRELMSLERWTRDRKAKPSPEEFLQKIGDGIFTISEFADATKVHPVTAGNQLLDLVGQKKIRALNDRKGKKKRYRVLLAFSSAPGPQTVDVLSPTKNSPEEES